MTSNLETTYWVCALDKGLISRLTEWTWSMWSCWHWTWSLDKIKIDGYVLSTMKNWILAQAGGVNVVAIHSWYIIKRDTKFFEKIGETLCNDMILSLSCRSSDCSLFLRIKWLALTKIDIISKSRSTIIWITSPIDISKDMEGSIRSVI